MILETAANVKTQRRKDAEEKVLGRAAKLHRVHPCGEGCTENNEPVLSAAPLRLCASAFNLNCRN